MSAKSFTGESNKRKTKIVAGIAISLLLVTSWAILFLPGATDSNVGLKVIGDDVRVIQPGEEAEYPIRVENKGNINEDIKLETYGTPEGWEAELDNDFVNLDSGKRDHVYLTVKSPSTGTRGPPVATIGVRAWIGSGKTGTNNATLIETITWSLNEDNINPIGGDWDKPMIIQTTQSSAITYKFPNTIQVKHIDNNGTSFTRNVTVPHVSITLSLLPNSVIEIGYTGSFDYEKRGNIDGQEGNPIQDTLEFKSKVTQGTVIVNLVEKGTRQSADGTPLIEVLSNPDVITDVGSIDITIPFETTGGLFSAGITGGTAEVEVYDGTVDLEANDNTTTIETSLSEAPKGVAINKIDETVNVTDINKDVVTITGDVEILKPTDIPPIEIAPGKNILIIDPLDTLELKLKGNEKYKVEIKKYRKDEEVEIITIDDIEDGGEDTFIIKDGSYEIKTTSDTEKNVIITIQIGDKIYTLNLPLIKDEEYVLKDVDIDKGTATVVITDADGKEIEIKDIPSDTTADEFKEMRKEEKEPPKEGIPTTTVIGIIGLILIVLIIGVLIFGKKSKKEEKEVKDLWKKIEEEPDEEKEVTFEEEIPAEEEKVAPVEEEEKVPEEEKEEPTEEKEEAPVVEEEKVTEEEKEEVPTEEEKEETPAEEKKEIPTTPSPDVEEIYAEGVEFYKMGDFELAIENFDMALAEDPNHERAWFNKGFVLRKLDRDEEAIECFEKSIELNPGYEKAWYSKGFTLRKLENYKEALACFEKALEINPDYENARKGIEICREELGWVDEEEEVEFEVDNEEDSSEEKEETDTEESGPSKEYYIEIDGEKYDRGLLETAEGLTKGRGDGRISIEDAEKIWEDAQDNGNVTDIEFKTLEYILNNLNCTRPAIEYLTEKISKKE